MILRILLVAICLIVLSVTVVLLLRRMAIMRTVRERAFADPDAIPDERARELNIVSHWLMLAGFRGAAAFPSFITATVVCALAGTVLAIVFYSTGAADQIFELIGGVPGGVGSMFAPVFYASPWLLAVILACMPWLFVRRVRAERVALYEQDLPLSLDLLATLSESGLGFDTALTRIIDTRLYERPLAQEFRTFQADLLAGRPRVQSLRRLARRMEIPAISIFVSALVQAEQMGMGLAGVLRRQADDLRDRRRERANTFAMSLPVKRLVPMVLCFLPAIFVWAIGPIMLPLLQVFDRIIQQAR